MKKNLLKSCLVAIGLVAGTMGAWADDTYTEVYSRSVTFGAENLWSQDDIADWGGNANLTLSVPSSTGETGHGIGFDTNTTNTFKKEFTTISENSKIRYVVSWYMGSSVANNANYSYIQFGDKVRLSWGNGYYFYLNTDGASSRNQQIGSKGGNNVYNKQIEIIFNTATKTVEKFVFDGIDLTTKIDGSLEGNFNAVSLGFIRGGRVNWTVPCYLTSIEVSECKQAVQNVDYTINYTYNNETVYSVNGSSVLGNEVTASSVVYDSDNNRYLTVADVNPSMLLKATGNILNVPVRKPYVATLNINTVVAGESVENKNIVLEETDDKVANWVYTYPLYVQKDNKYYIADNKEKFGETGTFNDGDVINKTVSYNNEDKNVVFYAEAEGISGVNINYSNGATGVVGAQNKRNRGIKVGSLAAGTYEFNAVLTANKTRALVVREMISDPASGADNESEINTAIVNSKIFGSLSNSTESVQFSLDKETNLVVNGANSGDAKTNQSVDFDYVLIRQLSTPVTVSAAKYATYVTKYNVTVPADVKVYAVKANAEGTGIVKTEVAEGTVIPAGTGILVNAEETGNYDFAVTNDDAQQLTDNELLASDGEGVTSDGETCYALGLLNGKVGFALVAKDVVIPAGKAYLKVSKASGAKFISMDGELTGINNVNIDTVAEKAPYYTLEGVKTLKPTKGVFIYKGKKVIIK